ncbi:MAG: caspase family protein [Pseudomonadota bacterium]
MAHRLPALAIGLLLIVAGVLPAAAAKRVALVIGNNAYEHVPRLEKAVNDADAMARTLQGAGFSVVKATDLARREMNFSMQKFVSQVEPGDVAMLFFAGHGVEIRGENFLLPIDIPDAGPGQEDFVKGEAISLTEVLQRLKRRKAQVNIVILDACRNNPFQTSSGRSVGGTRGLARVNSPKGTFVMYSADAGEEALDKLSKNDTSRNSVFTRTLIPILKRPGLDLVSIARETRRAVRKLALGVSHQQTPAYYDAVLGDFYFTPGDGSAPVERPSSGNPPASGMSQGEAFNLAKELNTIEGWELYLSNFPDGVRAEFVKLRLKKLRQAALTPKDNPAGKQKESSGFDPDDPDCGHPHGQWRVSGVSSNDFLNMRRGPSTTYDKIDRIPYYATGLGKVECEGAWCRVRYKCKVGWVTTRYLRETNISPDKGGNILHFRVAAKELKVRHGGNRGHRVVWRVPGGQDDLTVRWCGKADRRGDVWCIVGWKGREGWARARFLRNTVTGKKPK